MIRPALVIFASICTIGLSLAAAGHGVLPGDVEFQRFVQRAQQPAARWPADFGNWIGSARVFAVVAMVVAGGLLVRRKPWDAAFLIAALAVRTLNGGLKRLFDSPRPSPDLVRVTEFADGLGFPSGHAMGAMLGYGALALIARRIVTASPARLIAQAICWLAVLLVGYGRIFVGAHWPSDVLGGYLWGALVLAALAAAVSTLRLRLSPVYSPHD